MLLLLFSHTLLISHVSALLQMLVLERPVNSQVQLTASKRSASPMELKVFTVVYKSLFLVVLLTVCIDEKFIVMINIEVKRCVKPEKKFVLRQIAELLGLYPPFSVDPPLLPQIYPLYLWEQG